MARVLELLFSRISRVLPWMVFWMAQVLVAML